MLKHTDKPVSDIAEKHISLAVLSELHPDSPIPDDKLTFGVRELIFHQIHSLNSGVKALELFQIFFNLCPPGQHISVRVCDEVSPSQITQVEIGVSNTSSTRIRS